MKHAREDYNRIQDPAGLIGEDEPVFLIRATDKIGWAAVEAWANLAEAAGASHEIIDLARHHAKRMRGWPNQHIPDIPASVKTQMFLNRGNDD
jgi:hypothetical protein